MRKKDHDRRADDTRFGQVPKVVQLQLRMLGSTIVSHGITADRCLYYAIDDSREARMAYALSSLCGAVRYFVPVLAGATEILSRQSFGAFTLFEATRAPEPQLLLLAMEQLAGMRRRNGMLADEIFFGASDLSEPALQFATYGPEADSVALLSSKESPGITSMRVDRRLDVLFGIGVSPCGRGAAICAVHAKSAEREAGILSDPSRWDVLAEEREQGLISLSRPTTLGESTRFIANFSQNICREGTITTRRGGFRLDWGPSFQSRHRIIGPPSDTRGIRLGCRSLQEHSAVEFLGEQLMGGLHMAQLH